MRDANRSGNELREQRHARMRHEEHIILRIERRVQCLLDAGKIYFRILDRWVIPVHSNAGDRQHQQQAKFFYVGVVSQQRLLSSPNGELLFDCSRARIRLRDRALVH